MNHLLHDPKGALPFPSGTVCAAVGTDGGPSNPGLLALSTLSGFPSSSRPAAPGPRPSPEIMSSSKPHPPVVGKVTHHSIELYWDLEKKARRHGPQEQWLRFSIEEEDPKIHSYGIIYTGYATKHVVEGLEPRTLYRFRLKVTSPSGECEYSPVTSVFTTREPISSEHLHRAVNVNDEDLLVQILEGGHVKVDVPNKFGFTALMVAAQKGYTRLVKILVSNGTDVNLKNGSGKDSLMLACYAGHLDVVKYLRRHGASWEARDLGGCTALHWAADGGHCTVIDWMIKDGCEFGKGVLEMARVFDRQNVVSLLEERKKKLPKKSCVH
ncbi:fibronectin type 3 and ankyrin repeat domains protein 1 isoform X3 [Sciurus carolinensis]|uniref:fibronectin type 3 and ankyrin repeat domains protein 1 isoform X3 n=1 Tax=Sciurus carolinensis TaxID=30640 RepID=UPI001FB569EE|nr:fibronectin type 3 and ankyrin repeat domains protein 1 isoform X3 [Sciurus carolinensis]